MFPFFTQAPSDVSNVILLLLDQNDRIIGIRMPQNATKSLSRLSVGSLFFQRFPISARDRDALKSCRGSLSKGVLLLHAGGRPVLMICHLYAAAGLTPVILPEGDLQELLDTPAAYRESLENVILSPSASVRHAPATSKGRQRIVDLLNAYCRPFFLKPSTVATLGNALSRLALHTGLLAEAVGCSAVCRFGQLHADLAKSYLPLPTLGIIAATLMAASRLCPGCEVTFKGLWSEEIGPLIDAEIPAVADTFPELSAPTDEAKRRGMLLETIREERSTHIRFAICMGEIGAQGLKNRDMVELYTALAVPKEMPKQAPRMPEGCINLFRNGKWDPGHR